MSDKGWRWLDKALVGKLFSSEDIIDPSPLSTKTLISLRVIRDEAVTRVRHQVQEIFQWMKI